MPPIEKPSTSILFKPSARLKASASAPICSNVVGDLARTAGDARVVEQDHLPVASQAIRQRRVPIIHGADVVLVKDERHASGLAESAIGEADAVGLDELRRRGLMCVVTYNKSPCGGSPGISQPAPPRV